MCIFICTGHNAIFYKYLKDYLLVYVLNILFWSIWYHCTVWIIRISLAFNASIFIFIFIVCLICPHGYTIFYMFVHPVGMYLFTHPFYLCYRLKLVAEERMVQGLWLHRPAVLPLGVLRRVLGSLLEEEQRRLQLRSLNRLRPLLRHAPPALRLVSRFPIPHYLLRTLG